MNKNKVFVYGTLKQGNSLRGLNRWGTAATFISDAFTSEPKYNLWNLGAFPAVSTDGNLRIQGEVWEVTDEVFKDLDRIEGYPNFYNRIEVDTTHGKAWMYYVSDIEHYNAELIKPNTNNTASWREYEPS
jgi:gamma-glutamylcyclotransferase (GGCT)/AIG2-like uncharacterized protein YtfP